MAPKARRILYISSVRLPSEKASGLAIMKQCEAFAQVGHVVSVLCLRQALPDQSDPFVYYSLTPTFQFIRKKPVSEFIAKLGLVGFLIRRLEQMLIVTFFLLRQRRNFDFVYARDQWMLFPALAFSLHKYWEIHTKHVDTVTKFVGNRVQKIVTISEGLKNHYSEFLKRNDIVVEPSGVDLDQFKNLPPQAELRTWLDIPADAKVVGYIGKYTTMGETKGVDEIIGAFALLVKRLPNAFLLLAGLEVDEIDLLAKKLTDLGVDNGRFKLCQLDQKRFSWYVMVCDALLIFYPDLEHYRDYMSPTKLLVYLASGRPVISSDLPSIKSMTKDLNGIYFIPPNDVNRLAKELMRIMDSKGSTSEGSKATTFERFSWLNRARRINFAL